MFTLKSKVKPLMAQSFEMIVEDSLLDPSVDAESVDFFERKNQQYFYTCSFCCVLQVHNVTCKETIGQQEEQTAIAISQC